jgi:hypothetical protein
MDDFLDEKEMWIFENGSAHLQQLYLAEYSCETQYLRERLKQDYPGFRTSSDDYIKQDSPTPEELKICAKFPNAYCALELTLKNRFFVVDNYLGKYKVVMRFRIAESPDVSLSRIAGMAISLCLIVWVVSLLPYVLPLLRLYLHFLLG